MNITAIDQALAELKQDRARIDRAIDGLNAIAQLHGVRVQTESQVTRPSDADFPDLRPPRKVAAVRKRAVKAAAKPKRKTAVDVSNNGVRCSSCGADDFPSKRGMSIHKRRCDGVRRNAAERKKASMDRWLADRQKSKKTGRRSRVVETEERDRLPMKAPAAATPEAIRPRCPSCKESFANARDLGIHQSRVHFGQNSSTGSSMGGL